MTRVLKISDLQRRTLFALARQKGLDLVGIRDLTPAGSVSAVTRGEADELIDRLWLGIAGRRRPRRGQRATAAQLRLIGELLVSTGVGPGWLSRFGVGDVGQVRDRETARKIIAGLSSIQRSRDPATRARKAAGVSV